VLIGVLAQPRVVRLVEQRQIDLSQVGDLDLKTAVAHRVRDEPLGDRQPDAAGTSAGDDD
jgi:hypothetical protein